MLSILGSPLFWYLLFAGVTMGGAVLCVRRPWPSRLGAIGFGALIIGAVAMMAIILVRAIAV